MLKEAIEKIESMAAPLIREIDGGVYVIDKNGEYEAMIAPVRQPRSITVYGLSALADMIRHDEGRHDAAHGLFVDVTDYSNVTVCSGLYRDAENRQLRDVYYRAEEREVPGFRDGYMDYDTAQIKLRSQFAWTEDLEYVLDLMSKIARGDESEVRDNGVTQTVKVTRGVQVYGMAELKPVVKLRPYRTFPGVEQPESGFLLRVKDDQIGLFEADGGMWKLEAKKNIHAYLTDALEGMIASGSVHVIY